MTAVTTTERGSVQRVQATADDLRGAILEAAGRLLAEEGPAALTVRRIAAEAGGSTMNVYSRFGGKHGVVQALFVEGFNRLEQLMIAAPTTDDPLDDLFRGAEIYRTFALANRTYYAVMFEGVIPDIEQSDETVEAAKRTLGLLEASAQRAIDAGALVHDDAMALAVNLWATYHGLVSLELGTVCPPDVDWARRYADTSAAVLRGFTPAGLSVGPRPD